MEACCILAGSSTTDLNDLAKEADAIMEVSSRAFSATGISGVHNPMSSTTVAIPKVRQGGQEVQQGRVQVGIPHPILRFHLLYYGPGKQAGRPLKISAVGPGEKKTMTVGDRRSGCSFLIDRGAEESVFPASAADKRHCASSVPLVAANGTLIKTWGKREASLVLGKGHIFTQEFHVADVTDSILGADFLLPIGWPLTCPTSVSSVLMTSMWL